MKLTLKNFRCHRDASFQIPDSGLVMLSGESGVGKTTILNAISYAMYGNLRKPYSHGTSACQVTLELKDMIIIRSNRPNRVIVTYQDTEYEDDAAQELIEKVYGMNFQEFMASSYVVQSLHNSVVSMTPAEQVKFVETLAFSDNVHLEYREKFREAVKTAKENLSKCEGRVSVAEKQLELARSDIPSSPPNIEGIDLENVKKEKTNLVQRLKVSREKLTTLQTELEELQESENRIKDIQEQKRVLEVEISQFNQLCTNLGKIPEDSEIDELEKKLESSKTLRSQTKSYQSHTKLLKKIKKYQTEYTGTIQSQIDKLHESLPSQADIDDLESRVNSLEEIRKTHEIELVNITASQKAHDEANVKITEIFTQSKKLFPSKQLSRIKKAAPLLKFLESKLKIFKDELNSTKKTVSELEAKVSKREILGRIYTCPCCSANLTFKDEELISASDDTVVTDDDCDVRLISEKTILVSSQVRLNEMEDLINSLRTTIDVLATPILKSTVSYDHRDSVEMEKKLESYRRTQDDISALQFQLKNIPNENLVIKDLRAEIKILAKGYPKGFKPTSSLEELDEIISITSSELGDAWKVKSEWSSLSREIATRDKKLRFIVKRLPSKKILPSKDSRTFSSVSQELDGVRNQILTDSERIEELSEVTEHIAKYEEYQKSLRAIQSFESQLVTYEQERKHSGEILSGAMGLEAAGKEAEILAMEKTIESINEHAKHYLEELFADPISVRLEGTKTTSRGALRTQMNTVVVYKGEESSIDDLSGGETQRVELAFLLAVNDMIGSKMIFLDECLNNLNAEINMDVISQLQNLSEEKLILVISHEAVQGVFDEIVTLG